MDRQTIARQRIDVFVVGEVGPSSSVWVNVVYVAV